MYWHYTIIINFCRNSILLQLTSASCVLALSRGRTLLESGISISCESLSDGTPCQIRPHCVCCDLPYLPKYCCDTHYGWVCSWEVSIGCSDGRTWVRSHSFSTALVYRGKEEYNILSPCGSHSWHLDGGMSNSHSGVLDNTQSRFIGRLISD